MIIRENARGFVSLLLVIGLAAIILALSLTVGSLTVNSNQSSYDLSQNSQALIYAESGAKDALQKIARGPAVTISDYTISFATNGCTAGTMAGCASIVVGALASHARTVTVTGQVGKYIRKISASVTLNDDTNNNYDDKYITNVSSWNENL